ncbi:MAG TPA: hypothetical protein VJZ73_13350 [Methylomirabilota bacterium]|nr:hypothetical protein [Methylomirabilota bacterium]
MSRLGYPPPIVFVVKVGQLFFQVDDHRVVLWYNTRAAGDSVTSRLRKGNKLRLGKPGGRRKRAA